MTPWTPDTETKQQISEFWDALLANLPATLGIPEIFAGCEVTALDPLGVGVATLPRFITVRINDYTVPVLWRGDPAVAVGDYVTVMHLREGDTYEALSISGSGGSVTPADLYLHVWVFDVTLGVLIPYGTIVAALAYAALAAGDYVLIPPGEYDETFTLVNGVYVCEMVPGSVIINYTGGETAVTGVSGGYIQVKEIRVTRAGADVTAFDTNGYTSGECTVYAELIQGEVTGAGAGDDCVGVEHVCALGERDGILNLYVDKVRAVNGGQLCYALRVTEGTTYLYGDCESDTDVGTATFVYGALASEGNLTIRGNCSATGGTVESVGVVAFALNGGPAVRVNGDVTGDDYGAYTVGGVITLTNGVASGGTADLFNAPAGAVLQVRSVAYDTALNTITLLTGDRVVMDLDGDTYIEALTTDDQIDVYLNGALDFQWVANEFSVLGGSHVLMADDTWIGLGAAAGRITFDDQATDYVLFDTCFVGINESTPLGMLHIQTSGAAVIGEIIQLTNLQSENALEIRDSGGNPIAGVDERGVMFSDAGVSGDTVFIGNNTGNAAATGVGNIGLGQQSLGVVTTGDRNMAIGTQSLGACKDGRRNVAVGATALARVVSTDYNIGIGYSAGRYTLGSNNTLIGHQAGQGVVGNTFSNNTYIGHRAGEDTTTGGTNTVVGYLAGFLLTTGSLNIFLGANAGYRQTVNANLLIVDNRVRADVATELTNAILYGVMAAAPADQTLRINANLITSESITVNVTTVNVAAYDVLATDFILHVTRTTTGVCAIDFKTAQMISGRVYVVKDAGGNASANNITLTTQGAEEIDGEATYVIDSDYDSVTLYCDGSDLFVI